MGCPFSTLPMINRRPLIAIICFIPATGFITFCILLMIHA